MITRLVVAIVSSLLAFPTPRADAGALASSKCAASKAKETGKKASALLKAFGKNLSKSDDTRLSASIAKAQSKFTKGFTKAESKGGCATLGDAGAIEAKVDAFVDDVISAGPLLYSKDKFWLCKPDLAVNQCFVNSLESTVLLDDGSSVNEPHAGSTEHPYDCFYVYPTVDLDGPVGNHTDFSDNSLELDPLLSQAARLNDSCRLFAPRYRQITLSTFAAPNADEFLEVAYADVQAAWDHYLANYNEGRDFVIMGHSQGTFMTTTLIQNNIDDVPALRDRMIIALLIGGSVEVPEGGVVGETFQNVPLCTAAGQTGCVIAYRTYAEGFPPAAASNGTAPPDAACTNPAALGGGKAFFSGAYFPLSVNQPLFNLTVAPPGILTPWVKYPDFYEGECVKDANNRSYLRISYDGQPVDARVNQIPWNHIALNPALLGTHILDYHFAMGDLIDLVEQAAAAMP